jgi:hypothetical protein
MRGAQKAVVDADGGDRKGEQFDDGQKEDEFHE